MGHSYGADRAVDSKIEIIEKDKYGRTMFTYYERYYAGAKLSFSALIISQQSSEGYVYYYEDDNYIIMKQELFAKEIQGFSDENLESLKLKNDWNKEVDLSKCVKKTITNRKPDIPSYREIIKESIFDEFNLSDKENNVFTHFLTADTKGDFIGYGSIMKRDGDEIYFAFLVIIDNEKLDKIHFFVSSNLYDYKNEFISFKESNGWHNNSNAFSLNQKRI